MMNTSASQWILDTDLAVDGIDPRPENTIRFPDGIPGFERCRHFVLLMRDDVPPLGWFQALDAPHPAFLVIDPRLVLPTYRCILSPLDRLRLDVTPDDALVWLAIATPGADEAITVNLRAPLVINPRVMTGYQVMPHHSLYPVRQRFTPA
jgi:flagellar assembly factor FliW